MRAVAKDLIPVVTSLSPAEAVGVFFASNSVEGARDTIWYLFKAWVNCPVEKRAHFSDEEIALFLDQLIEYYGVTQVTAAVVRDLFHRMINRINKTYFPVWLVISAAYFC